MVKQVYELNNLRKKLISLNFFILFLIIPFSGFYITKLPLSPIYFFIMFGLYLYAIFILISSKIRVDNIILLAFTSLCYFLFSQLIFGEPIINTFLNVIFSILVFIVVYTLLPTISSKNIIRLSKYLIYFSLPLLIIEALYRIKYPSLEKIQLLQDAGREDIMFYIYKFNSIMYQDSNFVAMFILSLFFFWIYLNNYLNKKEYLISFLLMILLFATISRAAIISMFLFLIFYYYKEKIYRYRRIIFIFMIFMIPMFYILLLNISKIDDSFASKFGIINKTFEYFFNTNLINKLFGVGFGNAIEAIGIGAHNFLITNLIEGGIIGLILMTVFWGYLVLKTKYKIGIVMFPFLIAGLSFVSLAIPYLYVIFAIILVLESRKNQIAK
ncbi:hypothetical protein AAW30_00306 [Arcobacter porcinus]|uniref:O-antigen polymerase n=1 Tax=Arcobacter porcinus TaxID=1935204 RepID=UPI000824A1BB|nr:O-antigen polymerase [Arcobacter porcinus]OCL85162.1 hypothetical protein AAW30_00306 [Arcobacter porcinus]